MEAGELSRIASYASTTGRLDSGAHLMRFDTNFPATIHNGDKVTEFQP